MIPESRRKPTPPLLSLVLAVATLALPAGAARAATCGPGMLTYAVHAAGSSTPSPGIRCVKVLGTNGSVSATIVWYGEGNWGGGNYRHAGVGYPDTGLPGTAADVAGNGEAFAGTAVDNLLMGSSGGWPAPATITVRNAWSEDWHRVDSVPWTLLPRPLTCGPNYDTWAVQNTAGTRPGGIRCFQKGRDPAVWLGFGDWDGRTYAHLGWTSLVDYRGSGAVDLCDPGFGSACGGEFPSGSLQISRSGGTHSQYVVSGAWAETWTHVNAATYSPGLKAPICPDPSVVQALLGTAGCTSGATLRGRGGVGPETNAPNTVDGCADGTSGTYHSDESIDMLTVSTLDGAPLLAGKAVRIDARIWTYTGYTTDYVDFFYAADATNPVWTHIATVQAPKAGESTVSALWALSPGSAFQAVRAQLRWNGSADACASGGYNDRDDLVFNVQ